jgi:3-deoxy-D-manno-octulosonate 8-phosphate phosphatase KdsC-like HAD superfamily phosphatase
MTHRAIIAFTALGAIGGALIDLRGIRSVTLAREGPCGHSTPANAGARVVTRPGGRGGSRRVVGRSLCTANRKGNTPQRET